MIVAPKISLEAFLKQLVGSYFPSLVGISQWEYDHCYPLREKFITLLAMSGYMHIQATKPDTLGM